MPRRKNGSWMLAMLVLVSLVVPGVVAARQQPVDGVPSSAATPGAGDDLGVLTEGAAIDVGPSGFTCKNAICTTRAQCQLWCDDPGATCAPSEFPPHRKVCILQ
jgi:hypothetical protein